MNKRDLIKFYTYLDKNNYLKERYKNGQTMVNIIGNFIKTIPNMDVVVGENKIIKLTTPLESLKLDLKCIEHEIRQLSPIPCRKDNDLRTLLIMREQTKKAIKILEENEA